MLDKTYKPKANMAQLNDLHGAVAEQLAGNLDDPKTLALAIKFLKDNEITADIIESETTMSLTQAIKNIANTTTTEKETISVEDMLELE